MCLIKVKCILKWEISWGGENWKYTRNMFKTLFDLCVEKDEINLKIHTKLTINLNILARIELAYFKYIL